VTSLVAFSKFIAYGTGGAERSTIELLRERAVEGDAVTLVSAGGARFVGRPMPREHLPPLWEVRFLEGMRQLPRFAYIEYALNRRRISRWFARCEAEELWTYGTWAPAAMNGFRGKTTYFVRSETDLGIVANYHTGWRRWAKGMYMGLEAPAIRLYRDDLRRAMGRCARVVANSRYMADRTRDVLGVPAEVRLPPVDVSPIRERLASREPRRPRWVVFVGDNVYKGLGVVQQVARLLPDTPFRIVSRFTAREHAAANILWSPWQADAAALYRDAALVIVPSQWEEGYGRVAREAHLLGIPVLVSDVGGLPEAVDHSPACLVKDFRSPSAWAEAVTNHLKAADLDTGRKPADDRPRRDPDT
jgi:glycosyltransferase involved in cell wall biosynthesis